MMFYWFLLVQKFIMQALVYNFTSSTQCIAFNASVVATHFAIAQIAIVLVTIWLL